MILLKEIMNKPVSYSAIILDWPSMMRLSKAFTWKCPEDWEWISHHVTIKLGALGEKDKGKIGMEYPIEIKEIGKSEKALAIKVSVPNEIKEIMVGPAFPHVTLAVNRIGGGKPVDSNKITDWEPIKVDFSLSGTVQEISK